MSERSLAARWSGWGPQLQSVLRIVAAAIFFLAGTMKLFAFPAGVPPNGGTVPLLSEVGFAGVLEVVGGGLLLLGLFTRPVAFILSGEMAVANFQFFAPKGSWPLLNGGRGTNGLAPPGRPDREMTWNETMSCPLSSASAGSAEGARWMEDSVERCSVWRWRRRSSPGRR